MPFIPLHVRSGFSYLGSALTVERLPFLLKKHGYSAGAITDLGNMSGYAPYYHLSAKAGVTPIFGMDIPLPKGLITLFVESESGYRNLLQIALLISENRLSEKDLAIYSTGLTIVIDCSSNLLLDAALSDDQEALLSLMGLSKNYRHCYLGLPFLPDNQDKAAKIRSFAASHSYNIVAFPLFRYEKTADAIALRILESISSHGQLKEKEETGNEYILSSEEISAFYSADEIANTSDIASFCADFSYLRKRGGLLHYENDEGLTSSEYLKKKSYEGLKARLPNAGSEYFERLDYELSVIANMGYSDYFLIVADYVNFAKNNGVMVGPGRGSGAGSLVSFALNIVYADPLKFSLLFERFLNPERQSMPDIDVDFSDVNRDKVALYLAEKYGKNRVGHVLTTQTIGAKEALRDIARVYEYPDREIELIISTIVNDKLSLRDDYRQSPQFKSLIDSDKYYLGIVSLASKIEGLPRQAGLHAAGVVLNNEPLEKALPVNDQEGVGYVCCLEKDYLEEQGFLKMDLLGLRNLSIVETTIKLIERYKSVKLDYSTLPIDDKDALALIRNNKTMGLFQLESAGMKRAIREIEPESFDDVAALLALFRPGPMESIPNYARRKKGQEKITYLFLDLEPILHSTYGIIVYQEQIMQMVRTLAGFSYGQADLFRRAISKKDATKLAALKDDFIKGCLKKGRDKKLSEEAYALIFKFADYGFNKSHAVSYAVLTCQMAYLKAHYPQEFYCAILDYLSPSDKKFKDTLSELKAFKIRLEVPDVNKSETGFVIDEGKLLFPLSFIKGLQGNFISSLLDERNSSGKFQDFFDFASRMKKYSLSLPILVKLIDAGSFDSGYPNKRSTLRNNAFSALRYAEMMFGESGQEALLNLGIEKPVMNEMPEDKRTDLDAEYAATGIMISGSPLGFFETEIQKEGAIPLGEIGEQKGEFSTAGIVKSIRAIITKRGSQMAFLELYDDMSEASFVLFSEAYAKCYSVLKVDALVIVKAHKDYRREGDYLVEDASPLTKET